MDEQIIDHRANFTLSIDSDYYLQNSDGLFQVSEGDPRSATGEFRYDIDPEPWFIKAPLNLGEAREYTGALSGRYDVVGAWTGTGRTHVHLPGAGGGKHASRHLHVRQVRAGLGAYRACNKLGLPLQRLLDGELVVG